MTFFRVFWLVPRIRSMASAGRSLCEEDFVDLILVEILGVQVCLPDGVCTLLGQTEARHGRTPPRAWVELCRVHHLEQDVRHPLFVHRRSELECPVGEGLFHDVGRGDLRAVLKLARPKASVHIETLEHLVLGDVQANKGEIGLIRCLVDVAWRGPWVDAQCGHRDGQGHIVGL